MRIEITGPIGSGKTTLAAALTYQQGWQIASEVPEQIPFWAEAYSGARKFQFEKDVSFLLFHGANVRERQPNNGGTLVCDFSFIQDLAYAQMGQSEAELTAYKAVHRHITAQSGPPNLVINLRCSTPTLLARIAARGRDPERGLTGEFLDHLVEQTDRLLTARGHKFPILGIDSEEFDFTVAPGQVIAQIMPLLGGLGT